MNEYDSGKIADIAKAAQGYQVTDNIEEADLIVFNTCSIREKAQEKVFSDLGRAREIKKLPSEGVLQARKAGTSFVARLMWTSFSGLRPCTACRNF